MSGPHRTRTTDLPRVAGSPLRSETGAAAIGSHQDWPKRRPRAVVARSSLMLAAIFSLAAGSAPAAAQDALSDLRAFPSARSGEVRRVIVVPREDDEDSLKVGIIIGRTMLVDCNRVSFGARLETRTVSTLR